MCGHQWGGGRGEGTSQKAESARPAAEDVGVLWREDVAGHTEGGLAQRLANRTNPTAKDGGKIC